MNMFELVRDFWQMAELEKFSPTAVSLYFYLLHRANTQRWRMPVRCPTESVRCHIETTKQSVLNAREELRRRGLIDFTPGTGKGNYALYTLNPPSRGLTDDLTDDLTDGLTDDLTDGLTDGLTDDLTRYKNKDNKTEIINNNTRASECFLEDLEERLSGDEQWQQSVVSLMSSHGITDADTNIVSLKLREFFTYLKATRIRHKGEDDCRRHFVNWLAKNIHQYKTNSNEHSTNKENRHGANQGDAAPASSYYDPF